jgi:antitoxin (DNA-binding transcriptional repressor) of toxin-antitoxin stability system
MEVEEMEKHITATQAVRDFSEVLNTIKFKGVHYIIERGGKPVASMKPIDEDKNLVTLDELLRMLKKLPRLDDELDDFATDLENSWKEQPLLPKGEIWE